MKKLNIVLSFFLFFLFTSSFAQPLKTEMSKPLDLDQVGVNKVLCIRNGNTVLFHFEPTRGITIKIFDSTRKLLVSRKELCRILDVFMIKNVQFKGMFDINGEAVLFFDQENRASQHILVRLRFNTINGSLIEEKLVAESKSRDKTMKFYIMKQKDDDNYSILFSTLKNYPKTCDLFIVNFNKKHESVREVQLDIDRKKYDYMSVIGTEVLLGGNMISIGCYKLKLNGTISHDGEFDPTNNEFDHFVKMYYVPKDSGATITRVLDASENIYPFHTYCTNNSFAQSINVMLLSYRDAVLKFGLELLPTAVIENLFVKLDEDDFSVHPKWMNNTMATNYLKQKKDSTSIFNGVPISFHTNQNGLSTMVSESFTRYLRVETKDRPSLFETYLNNICITQFDDDGNEIWGIVLPKAQYYKSYEHYYYANQFSHRWHDQEILGDRPEDIYNRQFVSFNTYYKGKNIYIAYNDIDKNFNNSVEKPGDTTFTYSRTNAVYYTINAKKEITKNYLFGTPSAKEYRCSFIEGADFDEKRGTYASVIQYRKGDKISLKMAWSKLD